MQCACPDCGLVMAWREKGVYSECRCPVCAYSCSACMGTKDVLSVQEIRELAGIWGIDSDMGEGNSDAG